MFDWLFDTHSFPARWHCGQWDSFTGWAFITAELLIFLAYYAIPLLLVRVALKQLKVVGKSVKGLFILFAVFILACGTGHALDALMFTWPAYRLLLFNHILTAVVSWLTIIRLYQILPHLSSVVDQKLLTDFDAKISGSFFQIWGQHLLLAFALIAIVGSDIWGLSQIGKIKDSAEWRAHTFEALQKIETVNKSVIELESSERAFIITGDERFIAEFKTCLATTHSSVASLRSFTIDNPSQTERVDKFEDLINKRIAQLQETLSLRRDKGFEDAIRLIRTGRDRQLMADVKVVEESIVVEEQRLLEMRTKELDHNIQLVTATNLIAALIGATVIVVLFVLMGRQTTHLQIAKAELAQVNNKLKTVNAELEQFAYIASHDLKAPLRAIMNLSSWIMEDMGEQKTLSDDTKKHLTLMQDRINKMNSLIEGILQVSRVGRLNTDKQLLDVGPLVKEVIDSLDKKKFTINVSAMPTVMANKVTLMQVFQNLISNSIKHHTRDDGQIDVTVEDKGAFYEFSVKDDGPGIDHAYQHKLFVMFQTIGVPKPDSTGIGLALCKKIVELHGGKIWLESDLGKGAKFTFSWPK